MKDEDLILKTYQKTMISQVFEYSSIFLFWEKGLRAYKWIKLVHFEMISRKFIWFPPSSIQPSELVLCLLLKYELDHRENILKFLECR